MESIISTFHIDWKIIVAQAFNFGVVFIVLYIYALKPLGKLMKERSETIAKGVTDASLNKELLDNTKKEYDQALKEARLEADKIFKTGKKEAEEKRQVMLEEARVEVSELIQAGKKSLESEKIRMVAEVRNELASLSLQVTEKVLKKKIDPSYQEEIEKELNNI